MATAAGSTIGALRVVIGADTTGLQRGLRDAGDRTADFKKQALAASAAIAAIGAAAAAAGAKLVGMARQEMNLIDSQVKLARAIGGTVNGLRAFKLAAEDMGIDGVEASLNRMNRRLGAAEFGAGAAAASVKMLGLDLKALAGMDIQERMASIADTIQASGMSAQQAARHLQNLGFEQRGVAELFLQGGDAIRASTAALDKYGLSVSQVDAEKIEQANDAFTRLGRVFEGIKTQLAVALAPTLERAAVLMESFAGIISTATPYVGALIDALITSAEAFAVAGAAAAAFFGPAIISGIATFTTAVGVGAVGAVRALTAAMVANPIGAIASALLAAGYAAYKFRDQINEAIGIDVVRIAKNAANTVINSFVAAYEDIKFVWSNFGDMMGGAVVGGINVAIRAINALITGALSGINSLAQEISRIIPGVDIGKIGDSAKIDLLNNEYSARLVDAVKERNAKIAEIMSTDRFASAPGGMVLTDDPEKPAANDTLFSPLGEGGASAGSSEEQSQAELQALREQLEARLQMLREFTATEQELEIFKHEKRLEDLRELWEAGIIPTEAEMMELREDLEQQHQDRLTEISAKAEQERARNVERWAQFELQQRSAVVNAAVGLLDQFAGESKAAAIASIALSKGLAIAQIIQNTAAAQMRAMAELGPIAGPPMAAKIGVMGAVQAGIVAATGLAQAASVSSRGTGGLQGGASGSVGGRSSAPSSGGMAPTGGGAGPRVNINLIEDRDRAGQVNVNRSDDEEVDADVFVADIRGGGPRAQALQETFNLRRVGS